MVEEINEEINEEAITKVQIAEEESLAFQEDIEDSIKEIENIQTEEPPVKEEKVKKKKEVVSVDDLYSEFGDFLKNKADIIEDSGLKGSIPTGIDVLDAILGGGFAIGAMNIIVGQPGSGKCLDYDEEIEIYVEE